MDTNVIIAIVVAVVVIAAIIIGLNRQRGTED